MPQTACRRVPAPLPQFQEWHPSFDVEGEATRGRVLEALAAAPTLPPPPAPAAPPGGNLAAGARPRSGTASEHSPLHKGTHMLRRVSLLRLRMRALFRTRPRSAVHAHVIVDVIR